MPDTGGWTNVRETLLVKHQASDVYLLLLNYKPLLKLANL